MRAALLVVILTATVAQARIRTIGGVVSGGGGVCPAPISDSFKIGIITPESNSAQSDAPFAAVTDAEAESITAQTEAVIAAASGNSLNDVNAAPADGRLVAIASWATGCTDNDASKTVPANANGQNDSVSANVSTNLALGDLTNPVILTSGSLNFPPGLTTSNPKVDLYFSVVSRVSATDTVTITFDDGAGHSGTAWTWGTAAENHLTVPLEFSLPAGTMLTTLTLKANYTASVVAAPQGAITLDAWAAKADTTL